MGSPCATLSVSKRDGPVRKKRLLGLLVFAAAAAAAAAWLPRPATSPVATEREVKAAQRPQSTQAADRLAALPQRETLRQSSGTMFSSQSWTPSPRAAAQAAPVVAPVAPPMPYRVAGRVHREGATQVILAHGDAVLTVREGDTLDGAYQVEKIQSDHVTLLYTPLNVREDLPVNGTLALEEASPRTATAAAGAGAAEATVRWEGPQKVVTGNPFDVALKLTSREAVRAAPLQLQFDAQVLEPLAVRAGGFFSGGLFSYRVNPSGSIFIGASSSGATASDAEFVVVRFKPIGASGTAELKISSLSLVDAAGRTIALQQPAVFRTVIGQ